MDAAALREMQAPIKQRYKDDPAAALAHLHAAGDFRDEGITATIDTWSGPQRAGFHETTGGDGSDACSGDMLLQALLGCSGVTLRSVATAMSIDIRSAKLTARGDMDARGTLGVSRDVPVGMTGIEVVMEIDTDADDEKLATLAKLTERYCVVAQTLKVPPTMTIRRA
ncbi:OsmC family protein [Klenkia terrae]|jgi:uncharacterized OsmC-like protein|uniref:OsmC family protein n=1 Tax=Klenkia terrae TaxID=1052259 RepID=A0ABU8E4M8_9ACTN|nr:OsmC family protein [Klenkia terrae]SSC21908.1 Uncharacterized OsmC-related protein [Klenkia terrae]